MTSSNAKILIIPRVLNLCTGNPSLRKGILAPLSRGHHQTGVTVAAETARSNSQAGSQVLSGSFSIKRMGKQGLAMFCKTGPFIYDISPMSCMFSSIPKEPEILESLVIPGLTASSTSRKPCRKDPQQESLMYLLKKHIKIKDVQRVEETVKRLDVIECNDPLMYSHLLDFYCNQGNLEKAMHYKSLMHSHFPTVQIFDDVLVNTAALLAYRGQFDEAEKLISEHSPKQSVETDKTMSKYVLKLLLFAGDSGDVGRIRQMLNLLVKNGYISETPSAAHLGPLVKFHLKKNDIDSVVEEFLNAVEKYNCTPCITLVFEALIEKSETDKLKKVMDAAGRVLGQTIMLISLAEGHIQANSFTQAVHILETSGVRFTEKKLTALLNYLVVHRKIEVLEEFVKVRKDLFVYRDTLYYHLIRVHVLETNVEKALKAWASMQKEGAEPSEYTLHLLGNFLTRNGEPVPFWFPKTVKDYTFENDTSERRTRRDENNQSERFTQVKSMSDQMENFLNEGKLTDAKKVCDDLLSGNMYPTIHVLKKYFQKLSDIGDVDALASLEQQLPARVMETYRINNHKGIAKINRKKWDTDFQIKSERRFPQQFKRHDSSASNLPSSDKRSQD